MSEDDKKLVNDYLQGHPELLKFLNDTYSRHKINWDLVPEMGIPCKTIEHQTYDPEKNQWTPSISKAYDSDLQKYAKANGYANLEALKKANASIVPHSTYNPVTTKITRGNSIYFITEDNLKNYSGITNKQTGEHGTTSAKDIMRFKNFHSWDNFAKQFRTLTGSKESLPDKMKKLGYKYDADKNHYINSKGATISLKGNQVIVGHPNKITQCWNQDTYINQELKQ